PVLPRLGGRLVAAVVAAREHLFVLRATRLTLARADHHDHLPSFHERLLLYRAVLFQVGLHPLQQLHAELLVHHLASPESQRDLGLVAVRQELDEITQLDLIVALFRARSKFHFLDLDLLLLAPCRLSFLVLLEHELAVVHDSTDRRLCTGRNLYEIQTRALGATQRILSGHDSELVPVGADDANTRR